MSKDQTTCFKGVAILLIVIDHCCSHFVGARLINPFGNIGVSLFLIVSGYGLNMSFKKSGLQGFWKKRILRVWLPYAIITLLAAPFSWDSLQDFALQMLCLRCSYWFVPYVIKCYIVFWVFSLLAPKRRLTLMMLISAASLFIPDELQSKQAFCFITGVYISEFYPQIMILLRRRNTAFVIASTLFVIGTFFLALKQLPEIRSLSETVIFVLIDFIVRFAYALSIILGSSIFPRIFSNKLLLHSGIISYELYLIHFRFYGMIGDSLMFGIIVISGSFLASWIFNRFINELTNKIQNKI